METNSSKTVLITGASGGLGEEIAYSFSRKGMVVVISGQNQENLLKVSEKCKAEGAAKVVIVAGVYGGRLDVLVNNAGTLGSGGGIAESTVEDLNEIYEVNIRAPFYLTKLCMPYLIKTEGCVVNVSSIATEIYIPECLQYSMAKSALDHFTKCGALELAKSGVRMNSINPSSMPTKILHRALGPEKASELFKQSKSLHPLGSSCLTLKEVSDVVIFLCSPESNSITGSCLRTDRGRLMVG